MIIERLFGAKKSGCGRKPDKKREWKGKCQKEPERTKKAFTTEESDVARKMFQFHKTKTLGIFLAVGFVNTNTCFTNSSSICKFTWRLTLHSVRQKKSPIGRPLPTYIFFGDIRSVRYLYVSITSHVISSEANKPIYSQ